jgi:hypothetical protein
MAREPRKMLDLNGEIFLEVQSGRHVWFFTQPTPRDTSLESRVVSGAVLARRIA